MYESGATFHSHFVLEVNPTYVLPEGMLTEEWCCAPGESAGTGNTSAVSTLLIPSPNVPTRSIQQEQNIPGLDVTDVTSQVLALTCIAQMNINFTILTYDGVSK